MKEVFTWKVWYEIPEALREKRRSVCVVTKEDNKDSATRSAVKRIRETDEADKYRDFLIQEIEPLESAYMDFD